MGLVPARRPGWSLEGQGNLPPRGMVADPPSGGEQNPAYRPSGNFILSRGPNVGRRSLLGSDGKAEKIERLGIPALAGL
jgi:hypothetical protein